MDKYRIRTSKTDSVKGIASTQYLDVNLKQTTKALPFPNVSTTLSQRTVYEEERQAGNKFRLILTIVPYCTNVLFNPLTEIIKDEGSDNPTVITDKTNNNDNKKVTFDNKSVSGKINPTRLDMIADTEYSSSLHGGYEYHPGYDFFDNHILRNQSFKIVNTLNNSNQSYRDVFNTIKDYMRDRNGNILKFSPRLSINSLRNQSFSAYKHLYLHDDILSIDESINQNLYEENGWWGFTNNTSIDSKELNDNTKLWDSMDISHALNNYKSCEFIDMYPDRTLFSFTPKYNKFKHKNENNWNVVVTYPYKNVYDHPICLGGSSYIKRSIDSHGDFIDKAVSEGNRWMGLKVMRAQLGSGKIGSNSVSFRTYTKHGLEQGDIFYLYYTNPFCDTDRNDASEDDKDSWYLSCKKFSDATLNGSETYYETEHYYKVTNVGDLSKNNNKYYFYVSNTAMLTELYKSYIYYVGQLISNNIEKDDVHIPFYSLYEKDDKKGIFDSDGNIKTELINKILKYTNFRIRRCVSGVKSTYYLRLFRKIPNLRAAKREMTDEEKLHTSKFNGVFDNYIKENACDPVNAEHQRLINNEQYQMAFATNIYNDSISQIAFMDGIDIEGLTDNLGRPLSEIYYTIVKNNAGYEAWYDKDEPIYTTKKAAEKYGDDYTVEFSHCFGKVTSGLEMFMSKNDTEETTAPISYMKKMSSANHITNITNDTSQHNQPIDEDEDSNPLENDISYKDTFFYGDLVEFNAMDFKETKIADVMHRFNTAQRELINNPAYGKYHYHEITEDDYDPTTHSQINNGSPFEVTEYSTVNGINPNNSDYDYSTIGRPEGYIYKANYPIKIREYSRIMQNSHYTVRVRRAKPVQKEGILIQVTTRLRHNFNNNDIIFLCDDKNDTRYITRCVKVIDSLNFLMSPDYTEIITNATDFEDMERSSNVNNTYAYGSELNDSDKNVYRYNKRFSWLELCEILNGKYSNDLNYPTLTIRRKNTDIPDYATYIGGNSYIWRNLLNIGDNRVQDLPDYIFANGYFYVTQSINFFLKRQDPYGNRGLYYDGEDKYPIFPNDPSGTIQKENNYLTKDTSVSC